MINGRISLLSIFIRYFILTIIFILALKIFDEYYFFKKFDIEILNIIRVNEIFCTERALCYLEQAGIIFFLPFVIVVSIVFQCYVTDSLTGNWSRNVIFLYGMLPFVFIVSEFRMLDMKLLLPVLFASLLIIFIFWMMLFQVKQMQFRYFSCHLFLLCGLGITVGTVTRINAQAKDYLKPSKMVLAEDNPHSMLNGRRIILVGSNQSFNFYYVPTERRGVILAKTE